MIPSNKLAVFMDMLNTYAKMSKDPRTKVGAVILRPDYSFVSWGYNGFPAGFPDNEEFWSDRDIKNAIVIHAEENALSYAEKMYLPGHILICTHYPCPRCAAKLVKSGINQVYFMNDKREDHRCGLTDQIFELAGVVTHRVG